MSQAVLVETPEVQEDAKTKVTGETSNVRTVDENEAFQHKFNSVRKCDVADLTQLGETSRKPAQLQSLSEEGLLFCFSFPLTCNIVALNYTYNVCICCLPFGQFFLVYESSFPS